MSSGEQRTFDESLFDRAGCDLCSDSSDSDAELWLADFGLLAAFVSDGRLSTVLEFTSVDRICCASFVALFGVDCALTLRGEFCGSGISPIANGCSLGLTFTVAASTWLWWI